MFFFSFFFFFFSIFFFFFFFFFSSRRRHTRYIGDWSSECALPISGIDGVRVEVGIEGAGAARKRGRHGGPDGIRFHRSLFSSGAGRGSGRALFGRGRLPILGIKIGRASCRERVETAVVGGTLKEKR